MHHIFEVDFFRSKRSLKNRKMLIESTFPPFLEVQEMQETKLKIEKMQEEYSMIEAGINRLNELWNEFVKEKSKESMEILMGRLQETWEKEILPHIERFGKLSDKLWEEYLKWRKNTENNL